MHNPKPAIPYIDLRGKTTADLVRAEPARAEKLLTMITGMPGGLRTWARQLAFTVTDAITKTWLARTGNPYRQDIDAVAGVLGHPGVHSLNLCYEWACTTTVSDSPEGPVMTRVLDWPFPAMGESMVVTRQQGPAGEFDNITWPGMAGVFNAVAKNRFAAALNQAPRRQHHLGGTGDWLRNRHLFLGMKGLPPAHLLRKTCEEARSYTEARAMLARTPVSIPTIYTLAGVKPGEGCVIERTETTAIIRDMQQGRIVATNHFQTAIARQARWQARRPCTYPRATAAQNIAAADINARFDWFKAPIANDYSRLVMNAAAASGRLELAGAEGPTLTTQIFKK